MPKSIIRYALLAALAFAPCAGAAELRADQKAALEKVLATIDPTARQLVRPQLEETISLLGPEQLALFVASATEGSSEQQQPVEDESSREASSEDLAYNRAQYEPFLRKHWHAKKAFDDFVDAELEAKCPGRDQYAVFREVERYELMRLNPNWQRASANMEGEAQIMGGTYAPNDRRYDFDFSKVRMTFDKAAVSSAVAKACAEWAKEAVAFKERATLLMSSGQSEAASRFQNSASAQVDAINARLETALDALSPASNYNSAVMTALQNPRPAK